MTWKSGTTKWQTKVNAKKADKSSKPKASKAKKGMDTVTQNIKFAGKLTPVQGIQVTNYLKYFVSPYSDASSFNLKDLPEARMWMNLYDRYRINGVSIKIIPRITQLTETLVDGGNNDSAGVYYTVLDRDSVAPSSITQLKRYKSCRVHKQTKGCRVAYNVKYPKEMWMDTAQDITPGSGSAFYQTGKEIGLAGGITIYGENFTEASGQVNNYIWADVEVTFKCTFQTYNPRQISLTSEGVVMIEQSSDDDHPERSVLPLYLTDEATGEPPVQEA